MAPELGYADAISALDMARASAPAPAINHVQMMHAAPPATRGCIKVTIMDGYNPEMLRAKLKHDHNVNSLLRTWGSGDRLVGHPDHSMAKPTYAVNSHGRQCGLVLLVRRGCALLGPGGRRGVAIFFGIMVSLDHLTQLVCFGQMYK